MNKNLSQNAAIFWKYSGETLLTKHQAKGTLLSQQSLAMSKHTIFIGKQGEGTQQEIFFGKDIFFYFSFLCQNLGRTKFGPKVVTVVINQRSKGFPGEQNPNKGLNLRNFRKIAVDFFLTNFFGR